MGTDCVIIAKTGATAYKVITVHWDGNPKHAGKLLLTHYTTLGRVKALVALGQLSLLGADTSKPVGHSWKTPVSGYCVAYGRDRGEKLQAAYNHTCNSYGEFLDLLSEYKGNYNYAYFWDIEDGWKVYNKQTQEWITLEDMLERLVP